MTLYWTFDIGAYRWSTQFITLGAVAYSAKIIPDLFNGVTERHDITGQLVAPNDVEFCVDNTNDALTAAALEGEFCIIAINNGTTAVRSWKFKIKRAVEYYGKIKCHCVDFLQDYLEGSYPNTPNPKEVWPSDDSDVDDDYCIPVVLGTAYIPVRSVNTGAERYYILGETRDLTDFPEPEPEVDYFYVLYASANTSQAVVEKRNFDATMSVEDSYIPAQSMSFQFHSKLVIDNAGYLYFSEGENIYKLNSSDMSLDSSTGSHNNEWPQLLAYHNDLLYGGVYDPVDGYLVLGRYNADTLQLVDYNDHNEVEFNSYVHDAHITAENELFVGGDNYFAKLDITDLSLIFRYDLDWAANLACYCITSDATHVYIGVDGYIERFSKSDLTDHIYTHIENRFGGDMEPRTIAIHDGFVYLGDADYEIIKVNASTLQEVARYDTDIWSYVKTMFISPTDTLFCIGGLQAINEVNLDNFTQENQVETGRNMNSIVFRKGSA